MEKHVWSCACNRYSPQKNGHQHHAYLDSAKPKNLKKKKTISKGAKLSSGVSTTFFKTRPPAHPPWFFVKRKMVERGGRALRVDKAGLLTPHKSGYDFRMRISGG